jgi:Endonuclease/Exonuclease/phosphatase family
MTEIRIAFWNLENLFDLSSSETALIHEFTPDRGWTEDVINKKIENLAVAIKLLNGGHGPDLLGICEIENERVAQRLVDRIGRSDYQIAQYNDGPDIRGIDTSLIYSTKVFRFVNANSHNVYLRYPTRDIFHVHLEVIENDAALDVIVNHWPARVKGQCETEPLRITAAEGCARVVDRILKFPLHELKTMPDNLQTDECIAELNQRWNKNIIIMGDFNDQPFDKSIINHLKAIPDAEPMKEWRYIFEFLKKDFMARERQSDKENYLQQAAYLYNCMWRLIPDGTNYNDKLMNPVTLLDQFIISRGLYHGEQNLVMDLNEVKIFKGVVNGLYGHHHMTVKESDGRPMSFEWMRKDKHGKSIEIRRGREPNTGYSDHFPIQAVIKTI